MSLSKIREQVQAQLRGEQPTIKALGQLTAAERAAVRAMGRRVARGAAETGSFSPTSWWM